MFDPRIPHGVRRVEGTRNPLEARIVLHGWFTTPSPFFVGNLSEEIASSTINEVLEDIYSSLSEMEVLATGTITVLLDVGNKGEVASVQVLTNTLRIRPQTDGFMDHDIARSEILAVIMRKLTAMKIPAEAVDPEPRGQDGMQSAGNRSAERNGKPSASIVLPFVFE